MGDRPGSVRRPISRAGIATARTETRAGTSTGYQKGTVMDRAYFIREIKNKTSEINTEIRNMRSEINQLRREQDDAVGLKSQQIGLHEELKHLQWMFMDHNLLLDKLRTSPTISVNEIKQEAFRYRQLNDEEKTKADRVFSERSRRERELLELERETHKLQTRFETELLNGPYKDRYLSSREKNDQLNDQIRMQTKEKANHETIVRRLESELRPDLSAQKALGLYAELHKLRHRKQQLVDESQKQQLSVPEAKERLLQQVRLSTQQTDTLIQTIEEAKAEVEDWIEKNHRLTEVLKDTPENNEKKRKFAEVRTNEKEADEFLSNASKMKQEHLEANTHLELTIIALLEYLSKRIGEHENRNEEEEENEDLVSQNTQGTLAEVLKTKRTEFEKNENIDVKLRDEINALQNEISSMESDLAKFENAERTREELGSRKNALAIEQKRARVAKELITQESSFVTAHISETQTQVKESETLVSINALEDTLRTQRARVVRLRDAVEGLSASGEYKSAKSEAMRLCEVWNTALCKNAAL